MQHATVPALLEPVPVPAIDMQRIYFMRCAYSEKCATNLSIQPDAVMPWRLTDDEDYYECMNCKTRATIQEMAIKALARDPQGYRRHRAALALRK